MSSETSSVWNICVRFSHVIWRGNPWWRREMSAVFSGYHSRHYCLFLRGRTWWMTEGKMQEIELIVSSIFVTIIPSASHTRAILLKGNLLGSVTFFWPIVASRPARTSLQHAFYSLQSANFSSINCKCHIWYHLPITKCVQFHISGAFYLCVALRLLIRSTKTIFKLHGKKHKQT